MAPTSGLFVPLQAHGHTFGVLALVNTGDRPPQSATEAATAVEVGRRAAIALENARLYTRTLEVAETLQRSLLTPPPRPPGLHIAARYRPADTHALVGGDFYDAFTQDDGTTQLVVGDVVGHDVQASAAMSELRSAVRIVAYDRHGSPARTLERVDRALTGLGFGTLATVLVAAIEAPAIPGGERTLTWASAGHLPPVLLRADGHVQQLITTPEALLGLDPATARTDHRTTLDPGVTVVLYTDGLVEVERRCGIDVGLARLTAVLGDLAGEPVEQLCDQLLDRLLDQSHSGPSSERTADAIALLIARSEARTDRPAH
jgi:serine phosphatase RsbU (regulator of sigma subunit)